MKRIDVDGVEVQVADSADEGKPAWRRRRFRPPAGVTQRQHLEDSAKRVVRGLWDYVTGDGDDLDRAIRALRDDDDGDRG